MIVEELFCVRIVRVFYMELGSFRSIEYKIMGRIMMIKIRIVVVFKRKRKLYILVLLIIIVMSS